MTTITDYSPFASDVQADPYPYYAWLRQEEPVYYNAVQPSTTTRPEDCAPGRP